MSAIDSEKSDSIIKQIAAHYKEILRLIGENPEREGLKKTPMRAAKALYDVTSGYRRSAESVVNSAVFEYAGSNIIVVKDIEFYSLCEHHILPFFGVVTIGYVPDGSMIGLSKLARLVEVFARRLQVQERLTQQICDTLSSILSQKGVIVVCEAGHLCMKMRGVEKQQSVTTTMAYSGVFEDSDTRRAFFDMIK
ncbi:MAG: GTP cyclohydrolase I FolE [Muribaculaceae bacterium]|nr:GTP cyclohydrolase I FolE [Muribaculaceae bacterium]